MKKGMKKVVWGAVVGVIVLIAGLIILNEYNVQKGFDAQRLEDEAVLNNAIAQTLAEAREISQKKWVVVEITQPPNNKNAYRLIIKIRHNIESKELTVSGSHKFFERFFGLQKGDEVKFWLAQLNQGGPDVFPASFLVPIRKGDEKDPNIRSLVRHD